MKGKCMKKIISVLLISLLFSLASFGENDEPSIWAEESIENLKEFNLLKEEAFSNYKNDITRLEFIYISVKLYEALTETNIIIEPSIAFKDTSDIYALKGASIGVTKGIGNGYFGPDKLLSREELAVLMVNTMKLAGLKLDSSDSYKFLDEKEFSSWSKEAIYIAKANNIVNGVGDDQFDCSGHASKEVALIIANKILSNNGVEKHTAIEQIIKDKSMSILDLLEKFEYSNEAVLTMNKHSESYDYDLDGLSDYYEIYRNFTDPNNPDTDGDGILDGTWEERIECTYVIEAQLRLIAPYDLEFMDSHIHQDIKVIKETDEYADVLIYLYPFNKLTDTILGNDNWKKDNLDLMKDISPGKSNDWDAEMQKDLLSLLKENGIDPDELNDLDLVHKVINFLEMDDYNGYEGYIHEISDIIDSDLPMFDWYTAIDENGNAVLNEKLFVRFPLKRNKVNSDIEDSIKEFEKFTGESWESKDVIRLVSSTKEMFYKRFHGSCSGTSEFYASIFQALGIPTKVMPMASTIEVGYFHNEVGNPLKSLYDFRVEQGHSLKNEIVSQAWLEGIKTSGSGHIMNYIYIGNRWILLDGAGGLTFNRQVINNDFVMIHKTGDYDFSERLNTISEQWLAGDLQQFERLNTSESFSESPANDVGNYYTNFSMKIFDVKDNYGEHMSSTTKDFIDLWSVNDYTSQIYNGHTYGDQLIIDAVINGNPVKDNRKYYAFDNGSGDNFLDLFDINYNTIILDKAAMIDYLIDDPELYLSADNTVFVSGNVDYSRLPEIIQEALTRNTFENIKSGDKPLTIDLKDNLKIIVFK